MNPQIRSSHRLPYGIPGFIYPFIKSTIIFRENLILFRGFCGCLDDTPNFIAKAHDFWLLVFDRGLGVPSESQFGANLFPSHDQDFPYPASRSSENLGNGLHVRGFMTAPDRLEKPFFLQSLLKDLSLLDFLKSLNYFHRVELSLPVRDSPVEHMR